MCPLQQPTARRYLLAPLLQSDAARANLDRALKENPNHEGALTLRGWIDATAGSKQRGILPAPLTSGSSSPAAAVGLSKRDAEIAAGAVRRFETVLSNQTAGKRDIDALMGECAGVPSRFEL